MSIGISFEIGGSPKFGPQTGSNLQIGFHCGPSSGQIYAHTPIARNAFGRHLDSLTNLIVHGTPPLIHFVQKASNIVHFVEFGVFRGTLPRTFPLYWGFLVISSYTEQGDERFLKD